MRMKKSIILLLMLVTTLWAVNAKEVNANGTDNRGQSGFLFLKLPVSARQVSLNESSLLGENNAMDVFVNVSSIADLDGTAIAYTRQSLYDDLIALNNVDQLINKLKSVANLVFKSPLIKQLFISNTLDYHIISFYILLI